MTVDTFAEAEALADGAGPRPPGSDAERAAAEHLAARLRTLGRAADIETFDVWPRWPLAYALHALAGIAASLLSLVQQELAVLLALLATALTAVDAGGILTTTRRLLGRRESQNLVSWGDRDRPGHLLLVAHTDSGPGGLAAGDGVRRLLAALPGPLRRPLSPYALLVWTLAAVFVVCLLRLDGSSGPALDVLQFLVTIGLLAAVPLLLGLALATPQAGENDNASGVALALRMAERVELEHFGVHLLFTGSRKAMAQGMRSFLLRHRGALDAERTVVLNLDRVGDDAPRYTRREGPVVALRAHVQLVELCAGVVEDAPEAGAGSVIGRSPGDGYAARTGGLPAITLTCSDERGYASRRLTERALAQAEAFCAELIHRIDAEIGPELRRRS